MKVRLRSSTLTAQGLAKRAPTACRTQSNTHKINPSLSSLRFKAANLQVIKPQQKSQLSVASTSRSKPASSPALSSLPSLYVSSRSLATSSPQSNLSALKEKARKRFRVKTGGIKSDGTTKRWYREVGHEKTSKGWTVLLDGRTVDTPRERTLTVPNEDLALAIASEWYRQEQLIQPALMPLMQLACTVVDTDGMAEVLKDCLYVLRTDLALNQAGLTSDDNGELIERHNTLYRPIIKWFEKEFGVRLKPLEPTKNLMADLEFSDETISKILDYFSKLSQWELVAIRELAKVTSSVVLACALWKCKISIDEAAAMARIEEEHQIQKWGEVEVWHNLDRLRTHADMAAAAVFLHLLPEQLAKPQ